MDSKSDSQTKVGQSGDSLDDAVRHMRCPKCGVEESIDFGTDGVKSNRVHFVCGSYAYRSGGTGWTSDECLLREENNSLRGVIHSIATSPCKPSESIAELWREWCRNILSNDLRQPPLPAVDSTNTKSAAR